jgi:chaperone required for assembly of F1-ATPase
MGLSNAKRFYKAVTVVPAGDGWEVRLDDRPVKAPSGAPLVLVRRALADAIAEEWSDQGERIRPDAMPFYRLVATAIDRVGPRRDEVISVTLKFAETDLLCYRAETPPELVQRQGERWQPLLDWARESLACDMRVTCGVIPVNQPAAALSALERALNELDAFQLTAISAIAAAAGSLVIALALARGRIDAETASDLAQLEEVFQAEQWGQDREAVLRRQRIRAEIAESAQFLNLLG